MALSRRIWRCCCLGQAVQQAGELGRLGQALGVREVRAHDQAVDVRQVADDLGDVVLRVGRRPGRAAGRSRLGRSVSLPPIHGPLRPIPRLLSMCLMKCGTQDAPNSATSTLRFGNRPNRLSKISADSVSSIGRSP